ncbi:MULTISPECIES: urease subunit alpha [Methylobacterium]|uniref:Urease subunit alpha n=1 Tax=Methylobacterium bullatum TaxID=570505 RepID=A0A679JMQ0_9HYPH|nr:MULTISPECIES: urease subunit alpha [Methylobacterium]KQO53337.1 urease subunit alpha [Methylobacterium sp. Leaf85]MBD8901493.1 urease subunit alpha [Methylobacterium bullatum]TXN23559.1 urease subunit alpha [Methylobacterium sp. WL19]CAA2138847.1 Urease subunit alpha [Methylobacterium bullatum]GJD40917.1 Urease subunit alpha [Methylobacterium bullatum]
MVTIPRRDYAALYGPTTGDGVRLADTSLVAVVEKDYAVYGDECLHGGGKTLRDGIGMAPGVTSAEGALDFLLCNVLVIDPVLGIVKGDLGIRHGKIVGIGKAGNPAIMDGVDPRLIVSAGTTVRDCEGLIATPGAIDVHVHFDSAALPDHAIASGITTLLGGSLGPITVGIDSGGPFNTGKMLQAAEQWPVNFGFLGRGNTHEPAALKEQLETGVLGLKIHEDWGAMPSAIDACLGFADEHDFQVQLHTDTLNESGFVEDTLAAIGGRVIHMYHTEGAGGGHAPDIIRVAGLPHCLPSSTNPTNPYTVNTFDEHLDMTMVCHHLNPALPEDVAFAESRIRAQTIAAEDVLHDIGAISMLGSDSQGMGRIHEVICRTWQLASKMKDQRGSLPEDRAGFGDNARIKRYIAKYTINAARTFGIAEHIGSLEEGKMADIVLWRPAFFGIKPELVIKGGFIAWGAMGDSAASLMTCEPMLLRPQWGAFGLAKQGLSACFVHPLAIERGLRDELGLRKALLPAHGTRTLSKADMLWNDACPDIRVDPQTFDVFVDGTIATCEPAKVLPLAQRYMLR